MSGIELIPGWRWRHASGDYTLRLDRLRLHCDLDAAVELGASPESEFRDAGSGVHMQGPGKLWMQEELLHRLDGPAVESRCAFLAVFNPAAGVSVRLDGPARAFFEHGLPVEDRPAVMLEAEAHATILHDEDVNPKQNTFVGPMELWWDGSYLFESSN
jgi:hypothetical protein